MLDASIFRAAVETAPAGIVVCDGRGTILFVNWQVERIFGFTREELTGRGIDRLIPAALSDDEASRPGAAGVPRDLEGRTRDGGGLPLQVRVSVAEPGADGRVVFSIVDLRARQQLQNHLVETSREHAAFERLVTDLAARFVMVQPHQVDDGIVDSLAQISEMLGLDRGTWWRVPESGQGDAMLTHNWTRPGYRLMQNGDAASSQIPWILSRLQEGAVVSFSDPSELPSQADREATRGYGSQSGVTLPFMVEGRLKAFLGFGAIRTAYDWPSAVIDRLRLITAVFGQALMRKESEERLQSALAEVHQLRDQLASENVQLRRTLPAPRTHRAIACESAAVRQVLEQIDAVASTSATVLLLGETGSGKEVFAQAIHRASSRQRRPMVTVNCGAIPATLIESELFGRERGAFTGALARQIGRFEMAHESTIFLDEIGDLPLEAQVKLLRVIQERAVERLGGSQPIKVNVRIIAATNRDLDKAVKERTFREDLFYRLNVFPIAIPPLRDRLEDITALAWTFTEECSTAFGKPITSIAPESLEALKRYHWPGNVRELRNLIERAVIVARGPQLVIDPPVMTGPAARSKNSLRLADLEAEQIRAILDQVGWRVRGRGGAAEVLGIKPNTLDSRMARLGIRRHSRHATAS